MATDIPLSGDTPGAAIHAKLASMEKRFDDHASTAAETREDVRQIRKRMEDGDKVFADVRAVLVKLEITLAHMGETQAKHEKYLTDHNGRLDKLERDESKRDGERGVWTGLVRSPAAAWLTAIIAGIVAFVTGVAKGH